MKVFAWIFDGLPGTPDNISVDEDGFFWIGFPSIRDPQLEKLGDKPFVRRLLGAISGAVRVAKTLYITNLETDAIREL